MPLWSEVRKYVFRSSARNWKLQSVPLTKCGRSALRGMRFLSKKTKCQTSFPKKWPFRTHIVWQGDDDKLGEHVPRFSTLVDRHWKPVDISEICTYLDAGRFQQGVVGDVETPCCLCGRAFHCLYVVFIDGIWYGSRCF